MEDYKIMQLTMTRKIMNSMQKFFRIINFYHLFEFFIILQIFQGFSFSNSFEMLSS